MKRSFRNFVAVAAFAIAGGIVTQASAAPPPPPPSGPFFYLETFDNGAPGWTFAGDADITYNTNYDLCCGGFGDTGTGFVAQFGAGEGSGGVASTVILPGAGNYALQFQYGAFGNDGVTPQSIAVSINGNPLVTITTNGNTNNLSALLNNYYFDFTNAGGPVTLSFADVSASSAGTDGLLDNVEVSSVPEPATWAMMLIGFAGVGFAGARMRRKFVRA